MARLETLAARDADGAVRVVVESPRGCGLKLKYEPELGAFAYGRPLPLGLTYPYDWGFVPGTRADDGDPLDALVISDVPSYPGVVIPCRPLGVVLLDQRRKKGGRERNDRLVLVPRDGDRWEDLKNPDSLSSRMRDEIEHFFLSTTFFSQKQARIHAWKGPGPALDLVRRSELKKRSA
jgi:inorganic pyrophosphatase